MRTYEAENATAPDSHTVVFKFGKPVPDWYGFQRLHGTPLIMPKHIYEGTDVSQNPTNWDPIGCGPFVVTEYRQAEYVVFEPNPLYWGQRPYLDRVIFRFIDDEQARLLAFEAGEVDCVQAGVPVAESPRLMADPDVNVVPYQSQATTRVCFNFRDEAIEKHPWIDDINVRKAMTLALDRDQMLQTLSYGLADRTETVVVGFSKFHNDDVPVTPYDPDLAEQLLDEAGYPRGSDGTRFSFEMVLYDTYINLGEILVEYWDAVGIECVLRPVESTTFFSTYENGAEGLQDYAAGLYHMGSMYPSERWIHGDHDGVGTQNMGFYDNTEVNDLFDEALSKLTFDERTEEYMKIQELVAEDYAFIFFWNSFAARVHRPEYHNLQYVQTNENQSMAEIWWEGGKTYEEFWGEPGPSEPTVPIETIDELIDRFDDLENSVSSLESEVTSLQNEIDAMEPSGGGTGNLISYVAIVISIIAIVLPFIRKS
jgi:peptide/nickel transport system substrate-binding protein